MRRHSGRRFEIAIGSILVTLSGDVSEGDILCFNISGLKFEKYNGAFMKHVHVLVMGGGPAGATAALTLRKLGHKVTVLDKSRFPRYKIGESLLPGAISIFKTLGVWEKIEQTNFIGKPSAEFISAQKQMPFTVAFTTEKPNEWIFDHAIQVERSNFDRMIVEEAIEAGVDFIAEARILDVDVSSRNCVILKYTKHGIETIINGDYLIDASGTNSPLVKKLGIRRYGEYCKAISLWSYFKFEDPFQRDFPETILTFDDGWVWIIPIENGECSVGMVVDYAKADDIKEQGADDFFWISLKKCARAMSFLDDAQMVEKVRMTRDCAYDALYFSKDRYFLSGDSACFTDPLFLQGLHLAVRSALSAASAIDALAKDPEKEGGCHAWYNYSYRDAYAFYYEFVKSHYAYTSVVEKNSDFQGL